MPALPPTHAAAWLSAAAYWYLTGLLAAMGFSLGFYLLRPATISASARETPLAALTWMDGRWYKQIATEGYRYDSDARSNVAFFPVYPTLGRALMAATGLPAEAALLIVSNLFFLAALGTLALYVRGRAAGQDFKRDAAGGRPVRLESATDELAGWVVLASALFPTGCFFRLTYSESTFFFLSVLAMYAMHRHWPIWAIAIVIGLAAVARPVRVALLAPFVIHFVRRDAARQADAAARARTVVGSRRSRFGLTAARLAVYLPLAFWGLIVFMAFQYHAFGDPLAGFKAQRHWRVRPSVAWPEKVADLVTLEPVRSVYDASGSAFWASWDKHGIPWFSLQFANPLLFLAAGGAIALGAWRRWLLLEEVILASLLLLIPYISRAHEMGMGSMGRFVAVVFPMYIVIGQFLVRLPRPMRAAVLAISGFFLAVYTALYAAGYVIF